MIITPRNILLKEAIFLTTAWKKIPQKYENYPFYQIAANGIKENILLLEQYLNSRNNTKIDNYTIERTIDTLNFLICGIQINDDFMVKNREYFTCILEFENITRFTKDLAIFTNNFHHSFNFNKINITLKSGPLIYIDPMFGEFFDHNENNILYFKIETKVEVTYFINKYDCRLRDLFIAEENLERSSTIQRTNANLLIKKMDENDRSIPSRKFSIADIDKENRQIRLNTKSQEQESAKIDQNKSTKPVLNLKKDSKPKQPTKKF